MIILVRLLFLSSHKISSSFFLSIKVFKDEIFFIQLPFISYCPSTLTMIALATTIPRINLNCYRDDRPFPGDIYSTTPQEEVVCVNIQAHQPLEYLELRASLEIVNLSWLTKSLYINHIWLCNLFIGLWYSVKLARLILLKLFLNYG